jgi:pimeloyl-ACP methyl ester carboxylesterase
MKAGGIAYLARGEGPLVLFLHGIGGEAEAYAPHLDLPCFRAVAWNMPGYGGSDREAWPPSFASLSLALAGLIGALGAERAHLVGHSIGGMLALEHAVRRPEQVASLTLVGTTPAFGGRDDSFKRAFLEARLAPLEAGQTMQQMGEAAAPGLVGPDCPAEVISAVAMAMGRVPEETWRGILECLVTFNRRDDLETLEPPCCLVAGSHDTNAPARTMARMAEKLPGAEYHELAGVGHMIPQEAPERLRAILRAFLQKVPA